MELPFVDEHCLDVPAAPDAAWAALDEVVRRTFGGRGAGAFARVIGCRDRGRAGASLAMGSTITGFRVAAIEPPQRVELGGRHRFSEYTLTFTLVPRDADVVRICAETRAAFPGLHGAFYKTLVIRSRIHVAVTRGILRAIKTRAEAARTA